jgi:hypothetical protein
METFLSGFAKGYIDERSRRLDEENRKDEIKFKYKLDALTQQSELRNKKKQEEQERYRQAKSLAAIMGDDDSINTFATELENGVSYETLQKRIAEKAYEKDPNYVKPTTTVKVPAAVSRTSVDIPGTDGPEWEGINAQIDEINPNLRMTEDDNSTYVTEGASPYKFKPKDELKVPDFKTVLYEVKVAEASGDPVAIQAAHDKLQATKDAILFQEEARAKADKKEITLYGITDEEGNLVDTIKGEIRINKETGKEELWNTASPLGPKKVEVPNPDQIITIDKDLNKRRYQVVGDLQKRGKDYGIAVGKYNAAMQASQAVEDVVLRNPGVTKKVTGLAVLAKNLEGEAQQAVNLLEQQSRETQKAFASNDPNVIQAAVDSFKTTVDQVTGKDGPLSPELRNTAIDKAIYESALTNAVYQYAAANGISGRSMSDKDVKMFQEMISAGGEDAILQNLDNINMVVLNNLMTAEQLLLEDQELSMLTKEMGVKGIKGVSPPRIGEMLEKINPRLRIKHDQLRKQVQQGYSAAGAGARQAQGGKQETPEAQAQREVVREVGKTYKGVGGKQFRYKGGNPKDPKSYEEVK